MNKEKKNELRLDKTTLKSMTGGKRSSRNAKGTWLPGSRPTDFARGEAITDLHIHITG